MVQKRWKFADGQVELFAEKVMDRGLCAVAQAESLRYKLLGGLSVRRCAFTTHCRVYEADLCSPHERSGDARSGKSRRGMLGCVCCCVECAARHRRCAAPCSGAFCASRSVRCTAVGCFRRDLQYISTAPHSAHLTSCVLCSACYGVLRYVMEAGAKGCEVIVTGKLRAARAKAMKFKDGYMISSGNPTKEFIDSAVRHVLLRQGCLGIKVRAGRSACDLTKAVAALRCAL